MYKRTDPTRGRADFFLGHGPAGETEAAKWEWRGCDPLSYVSATVTGRPGTRGWHTLACAPFFVDHVIDEPGTPFASSDDMEKEVAIGFFVDGLDAGSSGWCVVMRQGLP